MRATRAMLMLVRTFLSSVVMRATLAMLMLVRAFLCSVVMRAPRAMLMLVRTFLSGVVVRMFSTFGSMVVVAASTMHMTGIILYRELGGIGNRGNKAYK